MQKIITQPVIKTDRFILRPLQRSDVGLISHYASDARVALSTPSIPHPLPPAMMENYVERAMSDTREEDIWAMDGSQTGGGEVMGVISLSRLDRNQSEVSYWVAPAFWNTGLASDAVQALVTANPLGNDTMFASVFHDNPASARVLTHCGFNYLGDAETYCLSRDTNVPTWTYSRKL